MNVEDSHFNVLMVLLGIGRLVVQRLKEKKEHTINPNNRLVCLRKAFFLLKGTWNHLAAHHQ